MSQYNKIFTENLYNIGVFVGRYGENLTKRFKNINPGLPAFLYKWTEDAIMLEQVWSPGRPAAEAGAARTPSRCIRARRSTRLSASNLWVGPPSVRPYGVPDRIGPSSAVCELLQ